LFLLILFTKNNFISPRTYIFHFNLIFCIPFFILSVTILLFLLGWWAGKGKYGIAIFGVGFDLWCERNEHDKSNLENIKPVFSEW